MTNFIMSHIPDRLTGFKMVDENSMETEDHEKIDKHNVSPVS